MLAAGGGTASGHGFAAGTLPEVRPGVSTHDRTVRGDGGRGDGAGEMDGAQAEGVEAARLRALHRRALQRKAQSANEGGEAKAAKSGVEVSDPADAPEQEADAVADHVTDELHGGGASGGKQITRDQKPQIAAAAPGVGRKIFRSPAKAGTAAHAKEGKPAAKAEAVDGSDADAVLRAMDDILAGNGGRLIAEAPTAWQPQLKLLWQLDSGTERDGRKRRETYDRLSSELAPILAHAPDSDYAGNVVENMQHLRAGILQSEAEARVENTLVVDNEGNKEAIEIPDDSDPHAEGRVLGTTMPKLVDLIKTNLERAKKAGELVGVGKETLEKLETMAHVLDLAGGWLKLNDEEFRHELTHIKGVMNGVATYSELVKTVLEMGSSAVSLTCTLSGALMRKVGDEAMAEACEHTGAAVSASVGKVVAAVEVVHGLSVMFDPSATRDARIGGGVEAAAGIAGLAGGVAASAPIMGPYLMLKGAQYLYSEAVIGWEAGFLREVFAYMQETAGAINEGSMAITAASALQESEKDPEKRAALATVEKRAVAGLAETLDRFLGRCAKSGEDHGIGNEFIYRFPGNYTILAEAFTGPVEHRGAKSLDEVGALAEMTMNKIAWCFRNGAAIVQASAAGKHVEDVQDIQDEMDKKKKEKEEERQ